MLLLSVYAVHFFVLCAEFIAFDCITWRVQPYVHGYGNMFYFAAEMRVLLFVLVLRFGCVLKAVH